MPVIKTVVIQLEGDKININREGVTGDEMIKVIASLIYDFSNHTEASMADVGFDAVNYGINVFTPVPVEDMMPEFEGEPEKLPELEEAKKAFEGELDPQTDVEDAEIQ